MTSALRAILIVLTLFVTRSAAQQSLLPLQPVPPGNPITPNKALLGKALFWDEQMSSTKMTACGTCHIPAAGMTDPRGAIHAGPDAVFGTGDDKTGASRGPVGEDPNGDYTPVAGFGLQPQVGTRRALATINTGYFPLLFWDGRAFSSIFRDPITNAVVLTSGGFLENQVVQPPVNDFEMAHFGRDWSDVVTRIQNAAPLAASPSLSPDLVAFIANQTYPDLFNAAFGTNQVTASRIVMAIATYLRTLISDQSRFDAAVLGTGTLTNQEIFGFNLFQAVGCVQCHTPPFFGGVPQGPVTFVNTGVRPPAEDRGRFFVSNNIFDDGAFRVPSLRNVELRAPFFHNGGKATLMDVINFYDGGGDFPGPLFPLFLTQFEKNALQAFLKTLTDNRVMNELPPFDRPTLASETNEPTLFGTATPGSGGASPVMIAFEPPFAGNSDYTIGLEGAVGGGQAYLVSSLGSVPGGLTFGPLTVWVDPASAYLPAAPVVQGVGAGNGYVSQTFTVPASAVGVTSFHQWIIVDPGAAGFLSASEAMSMTVY